SHTGRGQYTVLHPKPRLGHPVHNDGPRLGTAIEADAASRAAFAEVLRRMHAVSAQVGRQGQAFGRARLHAQPAALALLDADNHSSPRLTCHVSPSWEQLAVSSWQSAVNSQRIVGSPALPAAYCLLPKASCSFSTAFCFPPTAH